MRYIVLYTHGLILIFLSAASIATAQKNIKINTIYLAALKRGQATTIKAGAKSRVLNMFFLMCRNWQQCGSS
jgi:hypothetical protein